MDTVTKPWEQQPGENYLWYSRFFDYYLPMPPATRSLQKAYDTYIAVEKKRLADAAQREGLTNPPAKRFAIRVNGSWQRAAARDDWLARAQAWDIEQRRQKIIEDEEQRQKMLDQHNRLAQAMLAGVTNRLKQLVGTQDNQLTPELTPRELKEWFALATKIQRESLGLPGEIQAQQVTGTIQQNVTLQGIVAGLNLNALDDEALQDYIKELEFELGKQPPAANPADGETAKIIDATIGASQAAAGTVEGDNTAGQNGKEPDP